MRLPPAAALALLVLPALSGCFSSPDPAPAASDDPVGLVERLPAGTHLSQIPNASVDPVLTKLLASAQGATRYTGFTTFEPTIGVTPSGGLFMSRSASVVRSLDAGATWEEIKPFTGTATPLFDVPFDNDPYVYVDPATGRVFVNANQGAVCTLLAFSDDEGETWTQTAGCPPPVNDHQTIVAAKPRGTPTSGYPNIVYMCTNGITTTNCARSLDGGMAWMPLPPAFVAVKDGCSATLGHMVAAPDGTIYMPKNNCGQPEVFLSKDDGLTWTKSVVSMDVGVGYNDVAIAVDEAGNVYAFWHGTDGLGHLSHSTDEGAAWSAPRTVSPPELTGMDFPAIAAGGPGKIAFAYVGTSYPKPFEVEGDDPLTAQTADPKDIADFLWFPYFGFMNDALDDNSTIVTITAAAEGDPTTRGQCGRTRCDGLGDFISIQIGPDGRPWAAFADACTEACAAPDGQKNNYQGTGGASAPGFVGTLARGPALRGDAVELPPLPEAAPKPAEAGAPAPRIALPEIVRRT